MPSKTIRILFTAKKEQAEIINALLMSVDCLGLEESISGTYEVFFSEAHFDKDFVNEVFISQQVDYRLSEIKDQNWNSIWEESFLPVIVGDYVAIRAAFHEEIKNVKHDIIIHPRMSFGTGHHATTWLMMDAMQQLNFERKVVQDYGTGTGILSILAEKEGAASILAIDNDPQCILNAGENIILNTCEKITLHLGEKPGLQNSCDIMLANINKNILIKNMDEILSATRKGGSVLLSGLLEGDEEQMRAALKTHSIENLQIRKMEGWISILLNSTWL
ncbi:MAG: 50S ribosomal protein L11 methyltransferase [Ferruginibacter sp.]